MEWLVVVVVVVVREGKQIGGCYWERIERRERKRERITHSNSITATRAQMLAATGQIESLLAWCALIWLYWTAAAAFQTPQKKIMRWCSGETIAYKIERERELKKKQTKSIRLNLNFLFSTFSWKRSTIDLNSWTAKQPQISLGWIDWIWLHLIKNSKPQQHFPFYFCRPL